MLSRPDLAAIFRRMADEIEAIDNQPIPETAPAPEPPPKPVIDLGTVKGIQQALNALATNLPPIDEDGVHGPETAYVTKFFQMSAGIPVTGEADEETVNTIHKHLFRA